MNFLDVLFEGTGRSVAPMSHEPRRCRRVSPPLPCSTERPVTPILHRESSSFFRAIRPGRERRAEGAAGESARSGGSANMGEDPGPMLLAANKEQTT
jgi:hypothetical protein